MPPLVSSSSPLPAGSSPELRSWPRSRSEEQAGFPVATEHASPLSQACRRGQAGTLGSQGAYARTSGPERRHSPVGSRAEQGAILPGPMLFLGRSLPRQEVLAALCARGVAVTVAGASDERRVPELASTATVLVVALEPEAPLRRIAALAHERGLPWIGWNVADDPAQALAAYQAGARLVLPAALDDTILLQAAELVFPPTTRLPVLAVGERQYRRGQFILLEDDAVLEVRTGVVRLTVLHEDGTEVLLGFHGPGQLVVAHPNDSCCVQLIAHTATTVVVRRWEALAAGTLARCLRERVLQLEAWAAMQARPYLDQRLLGVLSLLAEQFGRPHPLGTLIDLRITHAELAAAVGAARPTVTRTLGDLRTRGFITWLGRGATERFCLLTQVVTAHGGAVRSP